MKKKQPKIDWSKPALVINNKEEFVVQTTGKHTRTLFCGMVLYTGKAPDTLKFGSFCDHWSKRGFRPLPPGVQITLSNAHLSTNERSESPAARSRRRKKS